MAVLPDDLKDPKGLIQPGMFLETGDALDAKLQQYIDNAVVRAALVTDPTKKDRATTAYAYGQAFAAAAIRFATLPSSFNVSEEGSMSYSPQTAARFALLGQQYETDGDALVADFTQPVPPIATNYGPACVRPVF